MSYVGVPDEYVDLRCVSLSCRFQKGLPTSLMRINEECLAMPEPDYYVSQPLDEMVTVIKHAM